MRTSSKAVSPLRSATAVHIYPDLSGVPGMGGAGSARQTTCIPQPTTRNIPPMFTGIVEETGVVESIRPGAKAIQLAVRAGACARGLKTGDSVAVNGCCLTV